MVNFKLQGRSSHYHTCYSVIRGVGEVDLLDRKRNAIQPPATPLLEKPYENCPYLLLDVRDSDEYNACHITGGRLDSLLHPLTNELT